LDQAVQAVQHQLQTVFLAIILCLVHLQRQSAAVAEQIKLQQAAVVRVAAVLTHTQMDRGLLGKVMRGAMETVAQTVVQAAAAVRVVLELRQQALAVLQAALVYLAA
jgi:hypothetical protein